MSNFDIKPGYVYHIKDTYFDIAKDDKLMRNYEGGSYRPTYFCLKDEKTGLLWVIPMAVNHVVKEEILKRFKEIRRLYSRGVKMVFPDITHLEKLMLNEQAKEI